MSERHSKPNNKTEQQGFRMIIVDDEPEVREYLQNIHCQPVIELELGYGQAKILIGQAKKLIRKESEEHPGAGIADEYLLRIPVKLHRGLVRYLDVEHIDWFEAANQYVQLHVGTETYLVRLSMSFLELRLDPRHFQRVHRSTIVNLHQVKELHVDDRMRRWVVLKNAHRLPISQGKWERLHRAMQGFPGCANLPHSY